MEKRVPLKYEKIEGKIVSRQFNTIMNIYSSHKSKFRAEIMDGSNFLLAYSSGVPVGLIKYKIVGKKMELNHFCLRPGFKGKEIEPKLIFHLWGVAKSRKLGFKMHEVITGSAFLEQKLLSRKHYGEKQKREYKKRDRNTWSVIHSEIFFSFGPKKSSKNNGLR